MKLCYSACLSKISFSVVVFLKPWLCFQEGKAENNLIYKTLKILEVRKWSTEQERAFNRWWTATFGCLVTRRFWWSWRGTMIPRAPGSLPTQTLLPTKQSPTILCFKQGRERRGWRGVDESLDRTEEGHTGAMAIPKTTYLLSHNDSACQNNCQDT